MPPVFFGVLYHWLGGLASGSFYVPYKAVRKWNWEVYWLAGGFVSWIIAPWILAFCLTKGLCPSIFEAFREAPAAMGWAYLFGCLWGIGGLTFGLTMRYLGMSLGMAIALGYCTVLGTIMPPIVDGNFGFSMKNDPAFVMTILGLGVCGLGIILAGIAGMSKEREMDADAKKAAIKEFSFGKGILVATISGVFSACMAYGIQAAEPLAQIAIRNGTDHLWSGLPKLCIVLLGGFTSNFIWCAILLAKNKTTYQFFNKEIKDPDAQEIDAPKIRVNMIWNYVFSGIAGLTWYLQFFFYSMGETKMGEFQFSSWTLHMASIIIFSSLWGLALHEWRGTSRFTKFILTIAIGTLLFSTLQVGYANLMKTEPADAAALAAKEATAAQKAFVAAVEKDANGKKAEEKLIFAAQTAAKKSADAALAAAKAVVKAEEKADEAARRDADGAKDSIFFSKTGDVFAAKNAASIAFAAAAATLEQTAQTLKTPDVVAAFADALQKYEAAEDLNGYRAAVQKFDAVAKTFAPQSSQAPVATAPAENSTDATAPAENSTDAPIENATEPAPQPAE